MFPVIPADLSNSLYVLQVLKVFVLSAAGGLMGPVRMISSGHELTTDYDEKTLHELGFKDMQVTLLFMFRQKLE